MSTIPSPPPSAPEFDEVKEALRAQFPPGSEYELLLHVAARAELALHAVEAIADDQGMIRADIARLPCKRRARAA